MSREESSSGLEGSETFAPTSSARTAAETPPHDLPPISTSSSSSLSLDPEALVDQDADRASASLYSRSYAGTAPEEEAPSSRTSGSFPFDFDNQDAISPPSSASTLTSTSSAVPRGHDSLDDRQQQQHSRRFPPSPLEDPSGGSTLTTVDLTDLPADQGSSPFRPSDFEPSLPTPSSSSSSSSSSSLRILSLVPIGFNPANSLTPSSNSSSFSRHSPVTHSAPSARVVPRLPPRQSSGGAQHHQHQHQHQHHQQASHQHSHPPSPPPPSSREYPTQPEYQQRQPHLQPYGYGRPRSPPPAPPPSLPSSMDHSWYYHPHPQQPPSYQHPGYSYYSNSAYPSHGPYSSVPSLPPPSPHLSSGPGQSYYQNQSYYPPPPPPQRQAAYPSTHPSTYSSSSRAPSWPHTYAPPPKQNPRTYPPSSSIPPLPSSSSSSSSSPYSSLSSATIPPLHPSSAPSRHAKSIAGSFLPNPVDSEREFGNSINSISAKINQSPSPLYSSGDYQGMQDHYEMQQRFIDHKHKSDRFHQQQQEIQQLQLEQKRKQEKIHQLQQAYLRNNDNNSNSYYNPVQPQTRSKISTSGPVALRMISDKSLTSIDADGSSSFSSPGAKKRSNHNWSVGSRVDPASAMPLAKKQRRSISDEDLPEIEEEDSEEEDFESHLDIEDSDSEPESSKKERDEDFQLKKRRRDRGYKKDLSLRRGPGRPPNRPPPSTQILITPSASSGHPRVGRPRGRPSKTSLLTLAPKGLVPLSSLSSLPASTSPAPAPAPAPSSSSSSSSRRSTRIAKSGGARNYALDGDDYLKYVIQKHGASSHSYTPPSAPLAHTTTAHASPLASRKVPIVAGVEWSDCQKMLVPRDDSSRRLIANELQTIIRQHDQLIRRRKKFPPDFERDDLLVAIENVEAKCQNSFEYDWKRRFLKNPFVPQSDGLSPKEIRQEFSLDRAHAATLPTSSDFWDRFLKLATRHYEDGDVYETKFDPYSNDISPPAIPDHRLLKRSQESEDDFARACSSSSSSSSSHDQKFLLGSPDENGNRNGKDTAKSGGQMAGQKTKARPNRFLIRDDVSGGVIAKNSLNFDQEVVGFSPTSDEMKDTEVITPRKLGSPRETSVVVIGAGLSGLLAAKALVRKGFRVTILEAREFAGGRLLASQRLVSPDAQAAGRGEDTLLSSLPAVFTVNRASLAVWDQLADVEWRRLFIEQTDSRCRAPSRVAPQKGKAFASFTVGDLEAEEERLIEMAISAFERLSTIPTRTHTLFALWKEMSQTKECMTSAIDPFWILSRLEDRLGFSSLAVPSSSVHQLSSGKLFASDFGYDGLMDWIYEDDLDIQFGMAVETIEWKSKSIDGKGHQPIRIQTTDKSCFFADHVIVTTPVGILQKSCPTMFQPRLPTWKLESIDNIRVGYVNRVTLLFDTEFWSQSKHFFLQWERSDAPNEPLCFQFVNLSCFAGPVGLMAYYSGASARNLEAHSDKEIKALLCKLLKKSFKLSEDPIPTETYVSRWSRDEWSRGTHSSTSTPGDRDRLATPIENRLFFAGEATWRDDPSSAMGAFMSGLRAASEIIHVHEPRPPSPSSDEGDDDETSDRTSIPNLLGLVLG